MSRRNHFGQRPDWEVHQAQVLKNIDFSLLVNYQLNQPNQLYKLNQQKICNPQNCNKTFCSFLRISCYKCRP